RNYPPGNWPIKSPMNKVCSYQNPVVKLNHFYHPEELVEALERFVDNYNNRRYHESINNLTPADVYHGRSEQIVEKRKRIKADSIQRRRKLYNQQKLINL